jgi:transcription initiation factor TFIIE subunit alpha
MELAQQLVRSCARAFYDTKHILVIDALIIHSAYVSDHLSVPQKEDSNPVSRLRDDDMAYLMGMHTKELHKLCGRLREDRFLAV